MEVASWFSNRNKTIIQKWLGVLFLFYLVSLGIRMPSATGIEVFAFGKILLCSGICFHMALFLWDFSRSVIGLAVIVILLYVAIPYIYVVTALNVSSEEVIDAFCLGTESISCLLILEYFLRQVKKTVLSVICSVIIQIAFIFILLIPLVMLGYYGLNGCLVTGDILLTLFQTNTAEIMAYLHDRGILLWGISILSMIILCGLLVKVFHGLSLPHHVLLYYQTIQTDTGKHKRIIAISMIVLLASLRVVVYNVEQFYPYALVKTTMQTLQSYREYRYATELRKQRLALLHNVYIVPNQGGVYVVVIGESETRDHMQVYGYSKETTPWLTSFAKEKGTIVFSHAYSNHTHTVPVLTYALSEKNQYNQINLTNAYSIMETAKAAGYTTYWISNQQKYGAWDTPIAEIASTADHEIWLNENVGEQTKTSVYDEKLADYIPDIQPGSNVLIILHLMGCHGSYQDRYPRAFQTFTGGTPRIDEYDNSVLYNDFVLQCIYNRVKEIPDFKAFIYFSDHGEDVEHNASHESTKFSWTMARIPFLVHVSDLFMRTNPGTVQTMESHKEAYWTNDLMYDFLIDLLGIEGISHQDALDIASPAYHQDKTTLTTLHGGKKMED